MEVESFLRQPPYLKKGKPKGSHDQNADDVVEGPIDYGEGQRSFEASGS